MKNQKGVNLVSLSVAVIVIIAIAGTVLYNVRTNLGVQKLKSMQADIENLRGKVENYYLQYGALPTLNVYSGGIKQNTSIPKESNVIKDVVENAASKDLDTGDYYVIDLKAMENITLTYGEDYENLKDKSAETIQTLSNGTLTDVYIINSVSHNIFYVHGIAYEGKTYYTQYQDEEKDKIGSIDIDLSSEYELKDGQVRHRIYPGEWSPKNKNAFYLDGDYKAIIPAGFKVSDVAGETSIETGLVIKDNDGNEFVWIPIGIPWKTDSSKTIELGRYEFKIADDSTSGTIVQSRTDRSALRPAGFSYDFIEEVKNETGKGINGNAIAKDIEDFKLKTIEARGFWIGRYEARVENWTGDVVTSNSNDDQNWTGYTNGKLVEKPGAQVFNLITQIKAAELSRKMYKSNNCFESDLINSYAWDTATLFLQEYDNRTDAVKGNSRYKAKYSNQTSLSPWTKDLGTNDPAVAEYNRDKICNVYDMADDCYEWCTETNNITGYSCVRRGGYGNNIEHCVSSRTSSRTISSGLNYSFRPILYVK